MKQILSFLVLAVFLHGLCGCSGESSAQSSSPEAQFFELNKGQFPENGLFTKKQTKILSSQGDYAVELATYTISATVERGYFAANIGARRPSHLLQ